MELPFIVTVVLFIIAAIIILKVVKKIIKAIFLIIVLAVLILGLFVFVSYRDAKDIQENFMDSPKLFLIEENSELLAGFVMVGEEEPTAIASSELEKHKTNFKEGKYDLILGENYKIFVLNTAVFDLIEAETIELEDNTIQKQDLISLIKSENPKEDLSNILNAPAEYIDTSDQEIRTLAALLLVSQLQKENELTFTLVLLDQYKEGNIIIYPETMMFKLIKFLPSSLIAKFIKKLNINHKKRCL